MTPEDAQHTALQYAYRLLSYRGRSEAEMTGKLRMKGFDDTVVQEVLEALRSNGLVDDRRLALSLMRYAEETKHLGIGGTRRFLKERGIPADIVDEVVRGMDEVSTAKRLVEKKLRLMGSYPPVKILRRLYSVLYRKGYSPEVIRTALKQVQSGNEVHYGEAT